MGRKKERKVVGTPAAPDSMYRTEIVTFLDILGFREMVKNRPAQEVDRAIKLLRAFAQHDAKDPLGVRSISFSDSVVRMRPVDKPSAAFFELLDLVHAQGELIGMGVLVRGGVTYGQVADNEGRVFGPAFIDAYELESRSAIYPRIVVAPQLLAACTKPPFRIVNEEEWELAHIKKLLNVGDDGIWYVDYLKAFPEEMDDPDAMLSDWLKQHKTMIEHLASSAGDLGLGAKANWLFKYHNEYVKTLSARWLRESGTLVDELLIDATKLRSLHVFPDTLPDA